ncbi:organic cation transporter protein-like isoform X1 [Bombyx mandarina]|uniref:Organic cation transporter protein-like isoform X1 n=1 Tax=Bombyx mandarina TaxID=7092 RepID=A0A6J2KC82_BOMMA|nr:organic cation transporter protein-like isoform X1 [Bombyx mandarina]
MASTEIEFEDIIEKFKLFSPYHLKLVVLLAFVSFIDAWHRANYIMVVEDVNYWCKYECNESQFLKVIRNETNLDRCLKYSITDNCAFDDLKERSIETCHDWTYEKPDSFMGEFKLGCQDWKRTLVGTVHSMGLLIGLLIIGPLSDKYGRKAIFILCGIMGGIVGLGKSITAWYWIYVALEFVQVLIGTPFSAAFTLGIEMVPKRNRLRFLGLVSSFFGVGDITLALLAWSVPYWRNLLRVLYAPSFIFLIYIFAMDESIRWLLIKGRKEEAINIIQKAAKVNKIHISNEDLHRMKSEKTSKNTGLLDLLKITMKSRKLLLRTLMCVLMWMTSSFSVYTLLINSVNLAGNKYLNYGAVACASSMAVLSGGFLMENLKRRVPLITGMGMTGLIFIIQSLVPKEYSLLAAVLFFIGKYFSALAFLFIYLYTSELFPTYTRNTMHAFCSSVGRIGSILAPQTPLLTQYWSGIPSMLVGSLSLITAIAIFLVPDTSEDPLPDTVEEAEAIGHKKNNISTSRVTIISSCC